MPRNRWKTNSKIWDPQLQLYKMYLRKQFTLLFAYNYIYVYIYILYSARKTIIGTNIKDTSGQRQTGL